MISLDQKCSPEGCHVRVELVCTFRAKGLGKNKKGRTKQCRLHGLSDFFHTHNAVSHIHNAVLVMFISVADRQEYHAHHDHP